MIGIDQGLSPWDGPRWLGWMTAESPRLVRYPYGRREPAIEMPRFPRAGAKDIRFAGAKATIAPAITEHAAMWSSAAVVLVLLTVSASGARAQSSLPDASTMPGAINPAVTQKTIDETICVREWTRMVRPPVGYTEGLKR